jgi:Family of unknown function (DUF6011)
MNHPEPSFEGLDDLDSATIVVDAPKTFLDAQVRAAAQVELPKCYACRGTGKFVSYSGRTVGDCFTCHGTGKVSGKVAKSHATKIANQAAAAQERRDWFEVHSDVIAWIDNNRDRNSFADSLSTQLAQRLLSERQVSAVRENLAKAARRDEERRHASIAAEPTGSGLDLSQVPEGLYAVPNGETRLKVKINRPAPPSKWAGFIFVSDGAEYGQAKKYGRQAPGKTYTGEIVEQLKAIAADPRAACAAYGRLVGRCGVCGRRLEDTESVERGIGPICDQRF